MVTSKLVSKIVKWVILMCSNFVKSKLNIIGFDEVNKCLPDREIWSMSMREGR